MLLDQLIPAESAQDYCPHVLRLDRHLQEVQERAQLLISGVVVIGQHRNCVFGLQKVAVGRVVHQNNILRASIHHPQILQIVAFLQGAMLPVQPMRDEFLLGVEMVQNHIGVGCTAGGEDDYLCYL